MVESRRSAVLAYKRMRKRAPKGWRRVALTEDGILVCSPANGKVRKKAFTKKPGRGEKRGDMLSFVWGTYPDVVFVKYPRIWDRPKVRAHELEHICQQRELGPELFSQLYTWCEQQTGYGRNPFEIAARKAEKRVKRHT